MAAPFEIRNETLKQVRAAFLAMSSPAWDLAMMSKPPEEKAKADREFARLQRARLRLGNQQLAAIRDKLMENESDLEKGRVRVANSLENLNRVKTVLNSVSSFLDVVARVVPLA